MAVRPYGFLLPLPPEQLAPPVRFMSACACCGMEVAPGAYHPFAACLMFKGCQNGNTVDANLAAVVEYGRSQLHKKFEAALREIGSSTKSACPCGYDGCDDERVPTPEAQVALRVLGELAPSSGAAPSATEGQS